MHYILWISIIQVTSLMDPDDDNVDQHAVKLLTVDAASQHDARTTATPYKLSTETLNGVNAVNQNNQHQLENIGELYGMDDTQQVAKADSSTPTSSTAQDGRVPAIENGLIRSTNGLEERILSTTRGKRDTDIQTFDPTCAKGSTFCDRIDDYPTDQIDLLLQKDAQKFQHLLRQDGTTENIGFKFNDFADSLCESRNRKIYPKRAETYNKDWWYIVNNENYTQAVIVEECTNPNQDCDRTSSFPLGSNIKCRQKYSAHVLLYFDHYRNHLELEEFILPSCCQCIISPMNTKRTINVTPISVDD